MKSYEYKEFRCPAAELLTCLQRHGADGWLLVAQNPYTYLQLHDDGICRPTRGTIAICVREYAYPPRLDLQ
jgi:hypothetical protein